MEHKWRNTTKTEEEKNSKQLTFKIERSVWDLLYVFYNYYIHYMIVTIYLKWDAKVKVKNWMGNI